VRQLNNSLFFTVGAILGSQVKLRFDTYQQPRPMPHQWAKVLDHPWRLQYRNPTETLGIFGFTPGMTVLDLGCGTGTFTAEMAQMVGEQGRVHAVDLQAPLLQEAQARVQAANLQARVAFHHCGAYQLPLESNSVDLAVMIATFSQLSDKPAVLRELRRVLKPGARLAVSEELPDPAYLPPQITRRWIEGTGYRYGGQSGTLFCYSQIYFTDKEPNTVDIIAQVTSEIVDLS